MSESDAPTPVQPSDDQWTFAWLSRLAAWVGPKGEVSLSFGPVVEASGYHGGERREKPWQLLVSAPALGDDLSETGYGDTASEAALAYLAKLAQRADQNAAIAAKQRAHIEAFANGGEK